MREILVLLGLLCVLGVLTVLRVLGVLGVLSVLSVLSVCLVLGVRRVWVLAMLGVGVWPMLREVLCVGRAVGRVGRVRQGHLCTAVGDTVGVRVGDAVLTGVWVGADGAARGVLVGARGVALLGRLRWYHQTCSKA